MTKLFEIFKRVSVKEMLDTLERLYPSEKINREGYEKVIEILDSLTPTNNNITIHLIPTVDTFIVDEPIEYIDVCGSEVGEEFRLGLGFCEWSEWLGMEVAPEAEEILSSAEIVAHVLYEMTFYGFSAEEIRAAGDDIHESMDRLKKLPYYLPEEDGLTWDDDQGWQI